MPLEEMTAKTSFLLLPPEVLAERATDAMFYACLKQIKTLMSAHKVNFVQL